MKKRDYARGSQKMAGNEQIAAEVGKNPNGVGYVGMAYMKAGGVKVVPIDGVVPSQQTVLGKTTLMLAQRSTTRTANRADWRKSFLIYAGSGGQKIVAQVGFVPIK